MRHFFVKEREDSKIKPRLRSEVQGRIGGAEAKEFDGLDILESC